MTVHSTVSPFLWDAYVEKAQARWLEDVRAEAERDGRSFTLPSRKSLARHQRLCRQALRCNIARELTEKEYRKFSRRRQDSEKRRKTVLRRMKRLTKLVQEHAERYRRRLQADWQTATDLSEGQMTQIVRRMDGILEQLPSAIRQAHERIIGGRKVENRDTILSLYEPDVHVIVRKKAEAEVEFGNTLFLAEQEDGLIVDWKLEKEISPGDIALLQKSMPRMKEVFGHYPKVVGGDRGFSSRVCHQWLENEKVGDAICPRSPQALTERMKNATFRNVQRRRAQTEGRIGILKNDYLGRPLRSKSFEHREMAVTWAGLAHNLRLIARCVQEAEEEERKAA